MQLQSFLYCMALRTGSLFILWFTLVFYSLVAVRLILDLLLAILTGQTDLIKPLIILICIYGLICSGALRKYFPRLDEQYDKKSRQAKSLKQLSSHYFFLFGWFAIAILANAAITLYGTDYTWKSSLTTSAILTCGAGINFYFGLVLHSYRNVIISPRERNAAVTEPLNV